MSEQALRLADDLRRLHISDSDIAAILSPDESDLHCFCARQVNLHELDYAADVAGLILAESDDQNLVVPGLSTFMHYCMTVYTHVEDPLYLFCGTPFGKTHLFGTPKALAAYASSHHYQELDLPVIGWADDVTSLTDGSFAALKYRDLVVDLAHAMRDNAEELELALQNPEVLEQPSVLLDAVRVCQCITSPEQLGEFEELCCAYNLATQSNSSDFMGLGSISYAREDEEAGEAVQEQTKCHDAESPADQLRAESSLQAWQTTLAGADTVTGPSADPATAPADTGHAPSLQAMQNKAFSFDLSSGAGTGGPAGDEYSLAGVQDSAGSPAFSVNYQAQDPEQSAPGMASGLGPAGHELSFDPMRSNVLNINSGSLAGSAGGAESNSLSARGQGAAGRGFAAPFPKLQLQGYARTNDWAAGQGWGNQFQGRAPQSPGVWGTSLGTDNWVNAATGSISDNDLDAELHAPGASRENLSKPLRQVCLLTSMDDDDDANADDSGPVQQQLDVIDEGSEEEEAEEDDDDEQES